jgi:hypothetical protein
VYRIRHCLQNAAVSGQNPTVVRQYRHDPGDNFLCLTLVLELLPPRLGYFGIRPGYLGVRLGILRLSGCLNLDQLGLRLDQRGHRLVELVQLPVSVASVSRAGHAHAPVFVLAISSYPGYRRFARRDGPVLIGRSRFSTKPGNQENPGLHFNFQHEPDHWLVGPHHGAARQQSADSTAWEIHRSGFEGGDANGPAWLSVTPFGAIAGSGLALRFRPTRAKMAPAPG